MQFFSTNQQSEPLDFKSALFQGLAPDGGLYFPEEIPCLDKNLIDQFPDQSLHEIALALLSPFVVEAFSTETLKKIIEDAFNFPIPLTPLQDDIQLVELFHGPTLAFKDFAARFMARAMSHLLDENEKLTILVATSGDTGGAIAHAYHGLPNIEIKILYPTGRVSPLQEKQLTTLGGNVVAYEVDGSFDDCQRLVKEAFRDPELQQSLRLTSANSINIGRLLPQMVYHVYAYSRVMRACPDTLICVPSGNLGNVTAGLLAKAMGVPIPEFIIATNANRVVPDFFASGNYETHPSIPTISNAMDIGDPSNFVRMQKIYDGDYERIKSEISSYSVDDSTTETRMKSVFDSVGVVVDPHTAIGIEAVYQHRVVTQKTTPALVMSTAHAAKFTEVVEPIIGQSVEIPTSLSSLESQQKVATRISPNLEDLKQELMKG